MPKVGEVEIGKANCRECGVEFEQHRFMSFVQHYCDGCCEKFQLEAEEERRRVEMLERQKRLERSWEDICPPLYRHTDLDRLPASLKPAIDKVLSWQTNPTGMVLHGDSGLGKTRVAMMLLNRLHFAGRRVVPLLAGRFAYNCMTLLGKSTEAFADFYQGLIAADVVLLDDLGKEKLTERVECELFSLIEERSQHLRPIIVTTNTTGDTLESRFDDDRAGPFLRRVREFCEPVAFVE